MIVNTKFPKNLKVTVVLNKPVLPFNEQNRSFYISNELKAVTWQLKRCLTRRVSASLSQGQKPSSSHSRYIYRIIF